MGAAGTVVAATLLVRVVARGVGVLLRITCGVMVGVGVLVGNAVGLGVELTRRTKSSPPVNPQPAVRNSARHPKTITLNTVLCPPVAKSAMGSTISQLIGD